MRLAAIKLGGMEVAAIVTSLGVVPVADVNKKTGQNWATDVFEIITSGQLDEIKAWYLAGGKDELETMAEVTISKEKTVFAPLYRQPRKIWGIGLNYVDHAGDLAEKAPTLAPASFNKFDTTIIGPGDTIKIPAQSAKTTGEAELAVIYGKKCKEVAAENWLDVVAGFTAIIDMTAEDILRLNPRYLTRAKNFDTFLSLGSVLITPDEIADVTKLNVATVLNGEIHAQNVVANMTFPPDYLISFHSQVATMLPGDIILTGTPRAVHIQDGDTVECRIGGFEAVVNPVKQL
ncbi:MAG: fumarylacetoacetate hydrolase family protein [Sporomusaceae bacterium]|jgi:2-keto-4-pentenoate hydratase/2-oxohepta-3-ene-1,7-dioic acid hydratase in catechol pathway|nr:fumarylacetoacetate hydrolase family protein [Sporomusaceae bacterium]